jgi:hypothetical protein
MKYTLDNLKFPVVAIGTQMIDAEVNFQNHTVLFKSRKSFNEFLGETEQIASDMYGEYMKKEVKSYENCVELYYHDGTDGAYERWRIYPINNQH